MPCGWEGNRRSGIALAMRHRLQWYIHLRAHGLRKGDEYPAYTPHGLWHLLHKRTSRNPPWCDIITTVTTVIKQVYVQLPAYAENAALPAFARRPPRCCAPCSNRSISPTDQAITAKFVAVAHAGTDIRTDGQTPDRCIEAASHTMRAVPVIRQFMH